MEGVARTAYYCCGVRMLDAQGAAPLCGDHLAERFMDADGVAILDRFREFEGPNVANAVRHRLIDDLLRERFEADPAQKVVLLGCGFDTRAYRLAGGQWLEIDNPALIAYKEKCLPVAQSPRPLQRLAVDFDRDRLEDALAPWAGSTATVVVLEGVTMYLSAAQLRATLDTLCRLLPGHVLICDLMSARFGARNGELRKRLGELGGHFAILRADPAAEILERGYRRLGHQSIVGRAIELGGVRPAPPRWLLNTFLRTLRDGYRVQVFGAPSA